MGVEGSNPFCSTNRLFSGPGGLPDADGKSTEECGGDFGLANKRSLPSVDALPPGCAPGVPAACIDQTIECRGCLSMDALDGLSRNCDEFDDGLDNDSCP